MYYSTRALVQNKYVIALNDEACALRSNNGERKHTLVLFTNEIDTECVKTRKYVRVETQWTCALRFSVF